MQPGSTEKMSAFASVSWCCFYGAGIIGCLVLYGILQEKVMTHPYDGVKFGYSVFLVWTNRIFALLFAIVMAILRQESLWHKAPLWKYLLVSASNVFASTCQYEALKYVTFIVQMLGKSFKMMPVMVWGLIISRKQYGWVDWLIAALVTGGVTVFLCVGPSQDAGATTNKFTGYLLLLGFLALDGLTSTMQELLFREHTTSKYNQMLYVNLLSVLVSLITLATGGALVPSFRFCGEHPKLLLDAFLLSISAVGGQFFIYSMIKEFGALAFAACMNVRQVVSIVVSYIINDHYVTGWQIVALLVVFMALFYKAFAGLYKEHHQQEQTPLLQKDDDIEKDRNHGAVDVAPGKNVFSVPNGKPSIPPNGVHA